MPRKDLGRPLLNDIQSSKKKIKLNKQEYRKKRGSEIFGEYHYLLLELCFGDR